MSFIPGLSRPGALKLMLFLVALIPFLLFLIVQEFIMGSALSFVAPITLLCLLPLVFYLWPEGLNFRCFHAYHHLD